MLQVSQEQVYLLICSALPSQYVCPSITLSMYKTLQRENECLYLYLQQMLEYLASYACNTPQNRVLMCS